MEKVQYWLNAGFWSFWLDKLVSGLLASTALLCLSLLYTFRVQQVGHIPGWPPLDVFARM